MTAYAPQREDQKLAFDAELIALRTPREAMLSMIGILQAHAQGAVLSEYEYWGLMFKLREIHYRNEYGGHHHRAPAEFRPQA